MKKRSVIKELSMIVSITLIISIIGIFSIDCLSRYEEAIHLDIIDRNETASCMHIVLSRMSDALDDYKLKENQESIDVYMYNQNKFETYLAELKDSSESRITTYTQLEVIEERFTQFLTIAFSDVEAIHEKIDEMKYLVQVLVIDDLQTTKDLYEIQQHKIETLRTMIIVLLILIILITYTILVKKVRSMKKGISHIVNGTDKIIEESFKVDDLSLTSYDELDEIVTGINALKNEVLIKAKQIEENRKIEKDLNEQLLEKEKVDKLLNEAKFNLLKGQVNPHFLFNTLSMISNLATIDPDKTKQHIDSLSDIMRYSINHINETVSFNEEFEVLQQYMMIQKGRFADKLNYEIILPYELEQCEILPMLIQPLVENSIKHGMGPEKDLYILCECISKDDQIEITIQDNGKGFDMSLKTEGTGLNNVKERLNLYYKKEAKFNLFSMKDSGCKIVISIPKKV